MSLLNLTDLPDVVLLEEGDEAKFTVKSAKVQSSDSGYRWHLLVLEVEDRPDIDAIFHKVWMPNEDDDEAQAVRTKRRIKETLAAFDLADRLAEFDDEDAEIWVGASAWGIAKQEVYEGQSRNAIASFVTRG